MKTEALSRMARPATGKLGPLGEGRDGMVGSTRWAATLRQRRLHYRCFEVTTPEGTFVVEYAGQGMAEEKVMVDGQEAAHGRSTWWFTPFFRFRIGSADAVLAVSYWPWLAVRWLRLIVGGHILYAEGLDGRELSADALLALLADPLSADGIEVRGWPQAPVPVPTNITCERHANQLKLTQRWFSWMSVMSVPFCLLVDAAVVTAYMLLPWGELPVISALALLPGILAGLGATYYVLARLVNRTAITLTSSELSIRHGPLPWPGNRRVPSQRIKGFRVSSHASRNYAGDVWKTYTVSALRDDGQQIELLHKIGSLQAARFLEQQVPAWLAHAERLAVHGLAA